MLYRWVQLQADGKIETLAQPQATPRAPKMALRHLAWLCLRDPEQREQPAKQSRSFICKAHKRERAYGLAQQFVI